MKHTIAIFELNKRIIQLDNNKAQYTTFIADKGDNISPQAKERVENDIRLCDEHIESIKETIKFLEESNNESK